jgi:hypothetical protein
MQNHDWISSSWVNQQAAAGSDTAARDWSAACDATGDGLAEND